jgi:erythromycin esterase-like protein
VRDDDGVGTSSRKALDGFERWPNWMWGNEEAADFLSWLRQWSLARPAVQRVGFYGLDVYSLWNSPREIVGWLDVHAPGSVSAALQALRCIVRFGEDPNRYARST